MKGSFGRVQQECYDLCKRKHGDYGSENISASGIVGIVVRLGDKQRRLENLFRHVPMGADVGDIAQLATANFEAIEDTLNDMANYATIARLVLAGEWTDGDSIYGGGNE